MDNYPLISVCVIAYNQDQFILDCLRGILAQDYPNIELVISNDFSTDNTHKKIQFFIDTLNTSQTVQLKYFNHEKNLGITPNLKYTLDQCTGDYIAICEGDDYWVSPDKLRRQLFAIANTACSASFHDVQYTKNDTFFESFINDFSGYDTKSMEIITLNDLLISKWLVPTCSFFFKRNSLNLPDFFEELKFGDFPLFCSVAAKGDFIYLNGITSVYRMDNLGSQINKVDPLGSVIRHLDFIRFLSWLKKESNLYEIDNRIQSHISKSKIGIIAYSNSSTYRLVLGFQKILKRFIN
jgi:glycosyltransferase involved in cell wall biosynthesis